MYLNQTVIDNCEKLYRNKEAVQKAFKWDDEAMVIAASALITSEGKDADTEKLKECAEILKANTGVFSGLRGNTKMLVLCKMAMSEQPEEYLKALMEVQKVMKKVKWKEESYKILASIIILDHAGDHVEAAVDNMIVVYDGMKEKHPWLTGSDDLPFAAILAVSDIDKDTLFTDMEDYYESLKKIFHDREAVQSLSHLLCIGDRNIEEKCSQLQKIFNSLKDKKHKYGKGRELTVLGALTLVNENMDTLVEEMIEADEYLKKKKGFGNFRMGAQTRRMYAALMVLNAHELNAASMSAMMATVLGIVITMEILMFIIIMSATTNAVIIANS